MLQVAEVEKKLTQYSPDADVALVQRAYKFAAAAHKGQERASGEPYVQHSLEVADILADLHLDATSLAAALLHDVPEDTQVTLEDVRAQFGDEDWDFVRTFVALHLEEGAQFLVGRRINCLLSGEFCQKDTRDVRIQPGKQVDGHGKVGLQASFQLVDGLRAMFDQLRAASTGGLQFTRQRAIVGQRWIQISILAQNISQQTGVVGI